MGVEDSIPGVVDAIAKPGGRAARISGEPASPRREGELQLHLNSLPIRLNYVVTTEGGCGIHSLFFQGGATS